jgi:hypothetical protein
MKYLPNCCISIFKSPWRAPQTRNCDTTPWYCVSGVRTAHSSFGNSTLRKCQRSVKGRGFVEVLRRALWWHEEGARRWGLS